MSNDRVHEGALLDDMQALSLAELARACHTDAEWLLLLIDEGILQPRGRRQPEWRFSSISIHAVLRVQRLQRDLGINLAGSALVLDMLDEMQRLRRRLAVLESTIDRTGPAGGEIDHE